MSTAGLNKHKLAMVDLDGTLVFTLEANALAYARALAEYGFTLTREDYAARCDGRAYRAWLGERFSPAEQRSIFYHELVHWLRLLPYKLRKDGDLAPMFYAGFIMVANDVYEWFEHE